MISDRYLNNGKATLKLNPLQLVFKQQIESKITSGEYQFEPVDCPVCEASNFHTLAEKDRYGLYCSNVVCSGCGLVMINPRMTDSSYNKFYNLEYRPLYTGKKGNAASFFKGQLVRGERLYHYLRQLDLLPSGGSHILEVGCGAGGILSYFQGKGFKVRGIDLGEEYLKYGIEQHELDLSVGTIHDIHLERAPDLVIYSHVLEHITDPGIELLRLQEMVTQETLIYVEVPGIKNLSLGYRKDPLRYFQNAHPFSFSLTTLTNLLHKYGFEMLNGDEFVKAVFKPGPNRQLEKSSDYQSVLGYLESVEHDRRYYAISLARFKVVSNAFNKFISSFVKK
jgi:2-polyprenyl-3-methyl-5-hydroxy-6-metoxy-1,4-benzoquinol methylase